jgi:hypothetical protein
MICTSSINSILLNLSIKHDFPQVKEVVDFAERLRCVIELEINKAIVRFASPFLAFDLFVPERFHQIGYTNPSQK